MKQFIRRSFTGLSRHLRLWHEAVHHRSLLEMAKQRVFLAGSLVAIAYLLIGGRLVDVMLIRSAKTSLASLPEQNFRLPRGDVLDRNGEILATHLVTASVYANPKVILNAKEAATKLAKILPEIGYETIYQRLSSNKGFAWIARHLPPKLQQSINQLGIPGVYLQKDYRRVYPFGPLVSHILGYCGVDGNGLSGVEKFFDIKLQQSPEPLKLSLDIRVQHIVHDELAKSIAEFNAVAGNAMVMDLQTGEMIAMVSLPDFDPNLPNQTASANATFNRNTLGVYEPGSTFKILNIAIGLETGKATLNSRYDARFPIHVGRFKIDDFKGKYRELTLKEAFIYSSNIAAIKIAQEFGTQNQKEYFKRFGVFKAATIEVPEIGQPLIPHDWRDVTTMTVSYGYGISVTPLQLITTVGGIINNGILLQPTFLHKSSEQKDILHVSSKEQARIVSPKTSKIIRELMRLVVHEGTAKKADIEGYEVFGKTGTAYQAKGRGYGTVKSRTVTFIGGFPLSNPQYMLIIMLDDPKPTSSTYGYATAGWNAAPTAGRIISRMAPVLGVQAKSNDADSLNAPGVVNVSHVTPAKVEAHEAD